MVKANSKKNIIKISYDQLHPETLEAIIEEFVTRDGTAYGETEVSLDRKIGQVRKQLKSGRAIILFDEPTQTCNIVSKDYPGLKNIQI